MSDRRKWLAAAVLVTALPLLLLHDALRPGHVLASAGLEWKLPWRGTSAPEELALPQTNGDVVRENLVYASFLHESLEHGRLPWWWPRAAAGLPFIGLGHTQALYPPSWVAVLFDPLASLGVLVAFHFVVAGVGMLVWLRLAGLGPTAACFGAVTFMLNGMFASRHGHPQFVASGCWLPWILAGAEDIVRGRAARGALIVASATALAVLAGHPSVFVFGFYFVGAWLVLRLAVFRDRPAALRAKIAAGAVFGAAVAVGVGLASIQLLATLELSQFSGRAQRDLADLAFRLPHWSHLLRMVFPDILGIPTRGTYWSVSATSFQAGAASIGTLPLVLAILAALRAGRSSAALGALVLGVLAVLYVPGVFDLAYYLPGFQFSRVDRLSIAWFLGSAFLAAEGLRWVTNEGSDPAERRILRGFSIAVVVAGAALAWLALGALPGLAASATHPPRDGIDAVALRRSVVHGLVWIGLAITWLAWSSSTIGRRWLGVAAIALAAVDLFGQASEQVVIRRAERMYRSTPATEFLAERGEPFRIAKFAGTERFPFVEIEADQESLLPANAPSVYGIEDLHVFGPLHPEDLDLLLGAVEPRVANPWRLAPFEREESLASPVLDLFGVRYVLAAHALSRAGLRLVKQADLFIYENDRALPRALFVPGWRLTRSRGEAARMLARGAVDPREWVLLEESPSDDAPAQVEDATGTTGTTSVRIVERRDTRVVVEKTGPDPGFVLLTDAFYPGWIASVDDEPARLLRADVMFRAVRVGSGTRRVVFEYHPTALKVGIWTTAAAIVAMLVLARLAIAQR